MEFPYTCIPAITTRPYFMSSMANSRHKCKYQAGRLLAVVCPAAQNDWSVNGWPHIDLIYFERGC